MNILDKKGNELSPDVQFDPSTGTLSIKGKSIPLDVDQFFGDVIQWLDQYSQNPNDHTKIEIDLKYLNGKSLRSLIALFATLKAINDSGKAVSVSWNVPKEADDLADISEAVLNDMKLPHDIRLN